jgi:hypothetical protein
VGNIIKDNSRRHDDAFRCNGDYCRTDNRGGGFGGVTRLEHSSRERAIVRYDSSGARREQGRACIMRHDTDSDGGRGREL